jgi:hypothetical protein
MDGQPAPSTHWFNAAGKYAPGSLKYTTPVSIIYYNNTIPIIVIPMPVQEQEQHVVQQNNNNLKLHYFLEFVT